MGLVQTYPCRQQDLGRMDSSTDTVGKIHQPCIGSLR